MAMKMSLSFALLLLGVSRALVLPSPSDAATCIGTACLSVALAGAPAFASVDTTVVNTREITIDANVPSLMKTIVDNRKALTTSLQQLTGPSQAIKEIYSPAAVQVKLPTNVRGAVRDALAGEVTAVVNGEPVDVTVRSKEGSLIVQADSTESSFKDILTKPKSNEASPVDNPKALVVDADIRSILKTSFDNRKTLLATAKEFAGPVGTLNNFVSPSLSIQLPSDLKGAAQDALSGEVSAVVNGEPVGLIVLPQEDLLTVAIQSPSLPKLPLWESTSAIAAKNQISFWERPFFLQPQLTNKNIAGGSALALGAVYGGSFAYYQYTNAQEEKEAQEKKKAMAAKQKAVAAKKAPDESTKDEKSVAPVKTEAKPAVKVEKVAVPAMSQDEEIAVEKARAAVEQAKKFDVAARKVGRNKNVEEEQEVSVDVAVLEEEQETEEVEERVRFRTRAWRKFGRWLKRNYATESE